MKGWLVILLSLLIHKSRLIQAEILTPPYFNLAEGKEIIASATCGVDTPGPELYCRLVGSNSDPHEDTNLIQGQVCDLCDPSVPEKSHPPEHAVDGMETWWQSPPLSRGMKYNEVNLTINLGQEFHVAYVYVKMGNSPRPGLWILEKSKDYGKTWQPWQYFSDSASDCLTYFGVDAHTPITRDDSVICTTEYSKIVPLEGGEIPISILNNRPSASHYFNSTILQEWTRSTNVRFRFLRTKNLLGHLMSVARQDPTVTRRYFYSIKDISIGGRCMCNGHADTCDIRDPKEPKKLECICQHNTYGPQCASCLPGYQQKKWQISTASKKFTCEPCNCFGHSNECIYDAKTDEDHLSLDIHGKYEGGGICQNCQHNTEGINCHKCRPKFYRPRGKPLNDTDVCQPCDCNRFYSTGNCAESTGKCECRKEFTSPNCDSCAYGYFGYPNCRPCECHLGGTDGYHCEAIEGVCPCKTNFAGNYCHLCAEGYYNFPECLPCNCNSVGSRQDICNVVSGNCTCKSNYMGRTCDICENGYYNYPTCTYCNCDARGTEPGVCNKEDGTCMCKEGYGGARCDQCITGYYGYPNCRPCGCSSVGSSSISCDSSGKCACLGSFSGRTCDECSPGYFMYPDCISCNCDSHGSIGVSCDNDGKCQCQDNFDGLQCDKCKEGFYNFPRCEGCNCDPAGIVKSFTGCGSLPAGELCECKERVEGRICNKCKALYWNLQSTNQDGCQDCSCHVPGVIGSIGECDYKNGQCMCKPSTTDRKCNQCVDGTYNLEESNLFGCSVCGCDVGGSISTICDKNSGQCTCQPRITGQTCTEPLKAHYFPTLHQFQYEVEDGKTPNGNPVRYGFDDNSFSGYSWKGYAVFSTLQDEIIMRVYIQKSSLYRMVLRYVNNNGDGVLGKITITPDSPSEVEQTFKVQFKPTTEPDFVTVAGIHATHPAAMVMNPGYWSISIKTGKNLFIDYFVLLPAEYYEATILTQDVDVPCKIGDKGLCRHYNYPSLMEFDSVKGSGGFLNENNDRYPLTEYFTDENVLREIEQDEIPLINKNQKNIYFELQINKPDLYILLITYITTPKSNDNSSTILTIETNNNEQFIDINQATLYPCKYTSTCRQVVVDKNGKIAVYNFSSINYIVDIVLKKLNDDDVDIAIESIVAIPENKWSLDFIQPKSVCVRKNEKCIQGKFPDAADAKKIKFEFNPESVIDDINRPRVIYDNSTKLKYLDNNKNSVIDIKTKVPHDGDYIFIVQYYQPDYPEFEFNVYIKNDKKTLYDAKIVVSHCPSNSGCRSIIQQQDQGIKFPLINDDNIILTFENTLDTHIWLDYILIIPAENFDKKILKKTQFDQTEEFIKGCGNNHFYINTNDESGFCRDSVFSLTADYNSGALPCQCSAEGTTSFECDKFGGQCHCKPNIIGRRCEICKTGFYGYPNCRPCSCPSTAICEPERGECICPSKVTGPRCDHCEDGTYGFHPIIGCEDCNCSPYGVVNNNLQCDLFNGTCNCKENIVGRQCDKCKAGYSQFPYCEKCDCDTRGTTLDICDQFNSECNCKENVHGSACDLCKEGTFNLQENNEEGCSKCFCFGKTTRCTSAGNLYLSHIKNMIDWDLVLMNDLKTGNISLLSIIPQEYNDTTIVINNFLANETLNKIIYFSAPSNYLEKKLTSYGGSLNYTINYSTGPFGKAIAGPDVILLGNDFMLFHYANEQPPSFTNFKTSVKLLESNFFTTTNIQVTREQFLIILQDLRGILIRATYWEPTITASLSDVSLDTTTTTIPTDENIINLLITSVEKCQCPPNYQGLSCEDCAPGYYRVEGSYGGSCVRCQCNGHADTCDVKTGICHNCKNGTTGQHCELCEKGYYGNATIGTPSDCLICACPLPISTNNFATGCEVNEAGNKISCECLPGYYGARCDSCAAGFFGRPSIEGEYCKPCECSGNIDTNEIGSCDSYTGECLHCLNNTYGEACNLCAPGYYGDAVEKKDCKSCNCDSCGMDKCDNSNGICICKDNVIGDDCNKCADNYYGFDSCNGCQNCECGEASESSQCDEKTGQCQCKPGVTGRKCDKCIAGYWNYGKDGCTSCGCNTEYSIGASCNTTTGQCSCLPGVIGEKCDHCPYRWVLKEGDGCYSCDSCIDDLLDVTDQLENQLEPVSREFNSVAESYYTNQRLKFINDTVNKLYPEVKLLDPSRIDLMPIKDEISKLELEIANQKRRIIYSEEDALKWKSEGEKTLENMNTLDFDVIKEIEIVNNIINQVESLAKNIGSGGNGAKIDLALEEAQKILKQIKDVSFQNFRDNAIDQSAQANVLVSEMTDYNIPVSNLGNSTLDLNNKMINLTIKIDDLFDINDRAGEIAKLAENINMENKKGTDIGDGFHSIKNLTSEIDDDIEQGELLNENATTLLNNADTSFNSLKNLSIKQIETYDKLNETLRSNDDDLVTFSEFVTNAENHAEGLYDQSLEIDGILTGTRNTSAVRAVSAYRDIEKAIQEAKQAALEASEAAKNATNLVDGMKEKTNDAYEKSNTLYGLANDSLEKNVDKLEQDLALAKQDGNIIDKMNEKNQDILNKINSTLKALGGGISTDNYPIVDATRNARDVENIIQNAIDGMTGVLDRIPNDLKETKNLSKDTTDSKRDISQANNQMDSVKALVPNMSELLNRLDEKQKNIDTIGNDLKNKIEALKTKIANAREFADRFKVGVTFYRNTTLQLKNPESLPLLATSTKISFYFRTNETNGFLLYLGNEDRAKLPHEKSLDFLALLIENGYPVLIIDLGSGFKKINSNKFVSDNIWRQLIVDRTGKNIKLIVREDIGNEKDVKFVKEEVLPGTYSIFNLDREKSKLFVGGYPPSFQMQNSVKATSFEGEMEELVVGDMPVSFWNFIKSENQKGALGRDRLINFTPSTGYRFDKNGFVVLSMRDLHIVNDPFKFMLKMNFKTFNENGLMYLMGEENKYFSLEMKNGKVLYQFDLGDGTRIALWSKDKYNDGQWHSVSIRRVENAGILFIDDKLISESGSIGRGKSLTTDNFYIGGYPPKLKHQYKSVTNIGFEGCIDNVLIFETNINLNQNLEALGVVPGCPVRFSNLVSFENGLPGYVRWQNTSVNNNLLQVNLKFRTTASNGLIFYITNTDQTVNSALSIEDGILIFKSQGEQVRSSSVGNKFNNNEWHVVTATHDSQALRLDIDDVENYVTEFTSPNVIKIESGSLYIGGLPHAIESEQIGSKSTIPFVGCIDDATFNGEIINFADTKERPNAFLGKCLGGGGGRASAGKDINQNEFWPPPAVTDVETITMASTQSNIVDVEIDTVEPFVDTGEGRIPSATTQSTNEAILPNENTTPAPPITPDILIDDYDDECKLPFMPEADTDTDNAWRFGTARHSRLEYRSLSGTYKNSYDFQINVKTLADTGIIFYASASTSSIKNFIALYLKAGKIVYSFDCGSGPAKIMSDVKINDNQWHTIVFKRTHSFGELIVDDYPVISGQSGGDEMTINVYPPFYVGGILPELSSSVVQNIETNKTFSGCLGNFMLNGQPVNDPEERIGVLPCSKRIEPGLFFYPGNGSNLFKAMDEFKAGRTIDILMDIKPRSTSGHLLSSHGNKDFLLLEMINGTVKFVVKTARGITETSFNPTTPHLLCDGNWHNIRAVKQKNALLLSVDHAPAPTKIAPSPLNIRVKHPIFVGGHQLLGTKLRGSTSRSQYVGCMRNLSINGNDIPLDPERVYGRVTTGVCPTI